MLSKARGPAAFRALFPSPGEKKVYGKDNVFAIGRNARVGINFSVLPAEVSEIDGRRQKFRALFFAQINQLQIAAMGGPVADHHNGPAVAGNRKVGYSRAHEYSIQHFPVLGCDSEGVLAYERNSRGGDLLCNDDGRKRQAGEQRQRPTPDSARHEARIILTWM